MVYNNPVSYHVDITPEMFAELADEPKFVAIKESSENVRRITDLKNVCGERYTLFCGVDDLVLESLLLGAAGWVSGLVNAFPAENRLLWDLATSGRWDEALEVYRWYTPLLHLDTHVKLVQYIKLAVQECGLGSESVRAAAPALDRRGTRADSRDHPPRHRNEAEDLPITARKKVWSHVGISTPARPGDRLPHRRRADPRGDRGRARTWRRHDGRAAGRLSRPARRVSLGRGERAARVRRDGRRPALRARRPGVRGGRDLLQQRRLSGHVRPRHDRRGRDAGSPGPDRPGTHRLETPVGVVAVTLDGPNHVTIDNVPSYRTAKGVDGRRARPEDATSATSPGAATGSSSSRSTARRLTWSNVERLTDVTWRIRQALSAQGITGEDGGEIDHIELFGPPTRCRADSKNFVLCPGKAYDRSPCGTGTSAKLACLAADGKLARRPGLAAGELDRQRVRGIGPDRRRQDLAHGSVGRHTSMPRPR